jgi:integrase
VAEWSCSGLQSRQRRFDSDPSLNSRFPCAFKRVQRRGNGASAARWGWDPAQLAQLLRAIDGYRGHPVTALALKLAPLVFVRPGGLRGAEWSQFDWVAAEWRIPATRMKMGQLHVVPFPDRHWQFSVSCGRSRGEGA